MPFSTTSRNPWFYYGCVALIVVVSFYFYAPCRFFLFNSDQAVHALMLKQFSWPRDAYYWGQNRLGSFLPLVTWPFYKTLPLHPLVTISLVHYGLLLFSWLMLAKLFQSWLSRLVLAVVMFLPLSSYYYFILIGHPYEAQLFCVCAAVFAFNQWRKALIAQASPTQLFVWHFLAMFCSILAYWVSEFSALIFVFAALYAWFDKPLRQSILAGLSVRNKTITWLIVLSGVYVVAGFLVIRDLKNNLVTDALYDQLFITKAADIRKQFGYLSQQTIDTLGFRDELAFFENLFYVLLLLLIPFSIWTLRRLDPAKRLLAKVFWFTILAGCALLFFSSWNYHSFFGAKYFSVLYVLVFIPLLISFERLKVPVFMGISAAILICLLGSGYRFCFRHFTESTVFDRYKGIETLPKGTLVCDYWNCYAMNAVAFDSLQSLPIEGWSQRNSFQTEQLRQSRFFYFFDDANLPVKHGRDTIYYFGQDLVATGKVYSIQGQRLMQYKKLH